MPLPHWHQALLTTDSQPAILTGLRHADGRAEEDVGAVRGKRGKLGTRSHYGPAQVVRVDGGDEAIDNADLKAPTPRFPAGSRSYPNPE